jgi:hypothetical protein
LVRFGPTPVQPVKEESKRSGLFQLSCSASIRDQATDDRSRTGVSLEEIKMAHEPDKMLTSELAWQKAVSREAIIRPFACCHLNQGRREAALSGD